MQAANLRLILFSLGGAIIGIVAAALLAWVWHAEQHPETDLHARLHQAVPLDAEEQAILDAKERAFAARRTEIETRLRFANGHLADAIAENPKWSSKVETATREVEQAAADLQRATLVHIFEMRAGLKAEHRAAYDKVLLSALRRGSQ